MTTRSSRLGSAARVIDELATVLATPLEAGLAGFVRPPTRGRRPTALEKARKGLQDQVRASLRDIVRETGNTSSSALDALLSLDAGLLSKAIAPVSQELADIINQAAAGAADKIRQLLQTAVRLLLQAYDWVLEVIGKDAEQAARKKVKGWIDELRAQKKPGDETPSLAEKLITSIYQPEAVSKDVESWLKKSTAKTGKLNETVNVVEGVSANFEAKAKQTRKIISAVGAMRGMALGAVRAVTLVNPPVGASLGSALPAIEALRDAVLLGLVGYILFAGYDHVDSGSVTFQQRYQISIPDRVQGIRETVFVALAPAAS